MRQDTPATPLKLSVVTICLNCRDALVRTSESVVAQTYESIEWIVVDGGSTDGTLEYLQVHRARIAALVSEPDRGIYDAMNKGIAKATGDYILFVNAGDRLASNDVVHRILMNPDVVARRPPLVSGRVQFECAGELWTRFGSGEGQVEGFGLPHQATLVDCRLQQSHLFDTRYRFAADHELWRRLDAHRLLDVMYVPDVVCVFELGGASSDPKNDARRLLERSYIDYLYSNRFRAIDWLAVFVKICARRCLHALLGERLYYKVLRTRWELVRSMVAGGRT